MRFDDFLELACDRVGEYAEEHFNPQANFQVNLETFFRHGGDFYATFTTTIPDFVTYKVYYYGAVDTLIMSVDQPLDDSEIIGASKLLS